jgi:hypothetical protein
MLIVSVISGAVSVVRLSSSLFFIYLTLGWNVRRARRAFEKELIKEGMPKKDAKRMSAQYAALKDETLNAMKRSMRMFPGREDPEAIVIGGLLRIEE